MRKLLNLAAEILANFLAPFLVYQVFASTLGDTKSLILSTVPPLAWSGFELAKTKRLDAISITVVCGIFLTIGATCLGGSPRLIQIRDALVTGMIGLMFLASLCLEKPIIFFLARATMARDTEAGLAAFETIWQRPGVPQMFRVLTGVWGVGLIIQTAILCGLAMIWPISRYLLLSPFITYGMFAVLMLWSLRYRGRVLSKA